MGRKKIGRAVRYLRESTASESRIQASVTDSVEVQQPGNVTLNTKTESSVFRSSVLALFGEPVVRVGVKTLASVSGHQFLQVRDTHRSSDNLSDTGHQHIDRLSQGVVLGAALHVERFDLGREAAQEDGAVDLVSHGTLGSLGNILTDLVEGTVLLLDVVVLQVLDGFGVIHAQEGALGLLEAGVELVDNIGRGLVGQGAINDIADHLLQLFEQIVKGDESHLSLAMGVLGQVATGVGLLGTEGLGQAVDISQGGKAGLQVQLGGLGQVGLLVVVVELEQGRTSLDRGLDHGGGSNLSEAAVVKVIAEGLHDLGADLQDAGSLLLAQDQVTEIVLDGGVRVLVNLVGHGLFTTGGLSDALPVVNSQLVVIGGLFVVIMQMEGC